ncbi:MAG: hypothetical protein LQ341_006709 [Variospora aurantia]|nr:MAG: hypothetical protein LQ341_006709 [Variospora aurantia]
MPFYSLRRLREFLTPSISNRPSEWDILWWAVCSWFTSFFLTFVFTLVVFLFRGVRPLFLKDYTWAMWYTSVPTTPSTTAFTLYWHAVESISQPAGTPMWAFTWPIIVVVVPCAVVGLVQAWVRNYQDFEVGWAGAMLAGDLVTVVSIMLKQFCTWPRPTFLAVCNITQAELTRSWLAMSPALRSSPRILSLQDCNVADPSTMASQLNGFPNNTSATAFAVGTYLSLYLNAKFQILGPQTTSLWAMLFAMIPGLGAVALSIVVINENLATQNVVIFSAVMGIAFGILAYRSVYTSVFDWRSNFLPMDRGNIDTDAWIEEPRIQAHLQNRKWDDDAPWLAVNMGWQKRRRNRNKPYVRRVFGSPIALNDLEAGTGGGAEDWI